MKTSTSVITALLLAVGLCPASAGVLAGPITNAANGHLYYLLTQNTWTASENEAITLGGHLAVISSRAEQDWVFSTFSSYAGVPRALWIGLTDRAKEGVFEWVAPECGSFSFWGRAQPDNGAGGATENFVHIWPPDSLPPNQVNRGFWNDAPDLDTFVGMWPMSGVVEVVPTNGPPAVCISVAVQVCWDTQTNAVYQVQWALTMDSTNWSNFGPPMPGNGAVACVCDAPTLPQRFYRVLRTP